MLQNIVEKLKTGEVNKIKGWRSRAAKGGNSLISKIHLFAVPPLCFNHSCESE